MTFKTYLLIGGLLFFFIGVNYAQIRLPSFDVELKINQNLMPGDGRNDGDIEFIETTNIHGGVHIQLGQHVALGGFYSRSFRGMGRVRFSNDRVYNEVLLLQKGLDVRLSTGRAKKWRQYLVVNYSQAEIVQVNEGYRLAGKFNALGASLGIMRKLSNKLYLNVIELGAKLRSDDIWFASGTDDLDVFFDAKMGLTYNIGKRK